MELKKILIIILTSILIILSVLIFLFFMINRTVKGPSVGLNEKRKVSNIVEKYLTDKYGDNNFKVTSVDYDFEMETLLDYSKKEGYLVGYKCDKLESAVSVKGIYPNISGISDWFLEEYYYTDKDKNSLATFEIFQEMKGRAPKDKIKSVIFNKIKKQFDANIQEVDISDYDINLKIPDDFGRIPKIYEIENDLNLYFVSSVRYTTILEADKEEEYETKLKAYLKNYFGGEWNISSNKKDNFYYISFSGNQFKAGDV